MCKTAPVREDIYIEYRVEPQPVVHKWQKEKEAFLAGIPVQAKSSRDIDDHWFDVDTWLEAYARERQAEGPIWDRSWLSFRIKPR